ncbi:MAG: hypothetical protein ACT4PW_14505 [Acidimicrobiia bacterium]
MKKAQAAVQAAKDPIDRLHALADLEHAQQADGDRLTEDFVIHSKAYAEAQGVPVSAFTQMGVSSDVLARAGFDVGRRRGRPRKAAGGGAGAASAGGRARVGIEDIKAVTSRMPKQFTLADLADKAGGGSPATVRKAVDELIVSGKAKKVGPKPNYSGRGRAPTVYELK